MKPPVTAGEYLARALRHDGAGREAEAVPEYERALQLGLDRAHMSRPLTSKWQQPAIDSFGVAAHCAGPSE